MNRQIENSMNPSSHTGNNNRPRQLYKSPLLAGILSMLPGLGQVYLGYYKHGFAFIATFAALILVTSSASGSNEAEMPAFVFTCIFFYCFNIIDAVRRAKLYNLVIDGITQAELPDKLDIPEFKGSLGMGIVMVSGGSVLFLHTMFGMSLAWIADWWPLGIIGFGVYLIIKDRSESDGSENSDQLSP